MLSKQAIDDFRAIYCSKYGKELPYAEAMKQANSLIRLYKAVLPPLMNEATIVKNSNIKNSS